MEGKGLQNNKMKARDAKQNPANVIFLAVFVMFVISGLLLLLLAMLLFKLELSEEMVKVGIVVIYVVSGLVGGLIMGKRMRGVGESVATLFTLIPQVGRRYQMAKRRQQTILRSSEDAGNYLVPLYMYERTEVVYLLCLDAKGGLISCREVGRGVVNAAEVSVRAIVETALSQKAVSVILSHNHVDAYALPSREDEITTRRVRDALLLVGITLADHIIVCGEDYVSFADSGLL